MLVLVALLQPMCLVSCQVMGGNGIELVRTWAFLNGDEDPTTLNGTLSIQPKAGLCMLSCTALHQSLDSQ